MKKNIGLIFSVLLWTFHAQAQSTNNQTSGTCGEHCTWTIDGNTLKLSGYGDISGYDLYSAPWYWDQSHITKVVIENESDQNTFKSIGKGTFCAMTKLKEVVLPEGLETIGSTAFHYCLSLETINLPDSLKNIAWGAFNATVIKDFVLPANVTLGGAALGSDALESVIISGNTTLTDAMLISTHGGDWDNMEFPVTLQTIYCDPAKPNCQAVMNNATLASKVKPYTQNGDRYVLNGVSYKSLSDMQNKIPVKRIYTVEEASKIAGERNTFTIRYK